MDGGIGTEAVAQLITARRAYDESVTKNYDEVFVETSERVRANRSVGKSDIGALLFWKRLRADTTWVTELHLMPDSEVRAVTHRAFEEVSKEPDAVEAARRGRSELSALPGFSKGDALASAVLCAVAPERLAVYDRRAHAALAALGSDVGHKPGRYARYVAELVRLVDAVNKSEPGLRWTPRDADLALYQLGKN